MGDFIVDVWKNITNDKIYREWPHSIFDPAYPIFHEEGYYDTRPLEETLLGYKKGRTLYKRAVVSSNDYHTGAYVAHHLNSTMSDEYVAAAVVGSAGMPFLFPARNMAEFGEPYLLMDGGSTWNTNIQSGINECLTLDGITEESQIDVDIIMLNPVEMPPDFNTQGKNTY